ncbi:hypothetical protein CSV77_06780 [Sporosarcina sp. P16b]|nr:hypothetical protein CSV77_06780 [Sporosarcina sp. P16b]
MANNAIIIPFKTKHQLETEKAGRVMREWKSYLDWEEANRHHIIERETEEQSLSQGEFEWLNEWMSEEK